MNYPRTLMTASAAVLGVLGIAGTFLPDEMLRWAALPPSPYLVLLVQVAGALYLGFASLDWMLRHTLIGGIYGRPVLMANLLHFAPAAIACARLVARVPEARVLWPVALVYGILALGFVGLFSRHPLRSPAPAAAGA